jgi:hypothetical protein
MSKILRQDLADNPEDRVAQAMFAVEADSFSYHALWRDHSHESRERRGKIVEWQDVSQGWSKQVGSLDGRPVVVSLRWSYLDGQLVLFWHGTSQVVDYKMIEDWLDEHFKATYDNDTCKAKCDASNFHHCLSAVQEANEEVPA